MDQSPKDKDSAPLISWAVVVACLAGWGSMLNSSSTSMSPYVIAMMAVISGVIGAGVGAMLGLLWDLIRR